MGASLPWFRLGLGYVMEGTGHDAMAVENPRRRKDWVGWEGVLPMAASQGVAEGVGNMLATSVLFGRTRAESGRESV